MTHPSTVADTLDAAADLLSKPGAWTKGGWAETDAGDGIDAEDPWPQNVSCFCMLGAIAYASGAEAPSFTVVSPYVPFLDFDGGALAAVWNDQHGRTQDEVVAKLREAAAKARGEVQP